MEGDEGVDIDALIANDVLWSRGADVEGTTELSMLATSFLDSAVGHELPLSKKDSLNVLKSLSGAIQ